MMRILMLIAAALVCWIVAKISRADASQALLPAAEAQLESARKEYEQALDNAEKLNAQKTAEFESLCAKINEVEKKLDAQKREALRLENLSAEVSQGKAVCAELSLEFARAFPAAAEPAVSASEIFYAFKKNLNEYFDGLKNPLSEVPVAATAVRDSQKLYGRSFRVGALRYFVSEDRAGFLGADNALYGEEYASQIKEFAKTKSGKIPADTSFGELLLRERSQMDIPTQIEKGGVWLVPILILGALSLVAAIVKFVQIALFPRSAYLKDGSLAKPFDSLASAIDAADGSQEKEDAAFVEISRASARLKYGISLLSITAAVAPLFGLLGTVSGIIKTFADLSAAADQSRRISDGIAEALITTEYGLIVAIPALILAALLSQMAGNRISPLREFARIRIGGGK